MPRFPARALNDKSLTLLERNGRLIGLENFQVDPHQALAESFAYGGVEKAITGALAAKFMK